MVSVQDAALINALETIYEASLDPERWYDTVEQVVGYVGGERGMVGLTDPVTGEADASYFYRLDPDLMQRWSDEYGNEDPWADRMVGLSEGEIGRGSDLMTLEEVRSREVYREIVEPVGAHDTCWTCIAKNRLRVGWLSAFQGKDRGPFPQESVEKMAVLAPHLVRAARIHTRFAQLEMRDRANEAALDSLSFALLTCRPDGQLVTANAKAADLLRGGKIVRLQGGRLECSRPTVTTALRTLIEAASRTAEGGDGLGGGTALLPPRERGQPMVAIVSPISARLDESCLPTSDARSATALVIISDPDRPMDVAEGVLSELWGFTPRETHLAVALSRGKSIEDYAEEAGLAIGTTRGYVKQLRAKTGTHKQGALVSLLNRTLDPTSASLRTPTIIEESERS